MTLIEKLTALKATLGAADAAVVQDAIDTLNQRRASIIALCIAISAILIAFENLEDHEPPFHPEILHPLLTALQVAFNAALLVVDAGPPHYEHVWS